MSFQKAGYSWVWVLLRFHIILCSGVFDNNLPLFTVIFYFPLTSVLLWLERFICLCFTLWSFHSSGRNWRARPEGKQGRQRRTCTLLFIYSPKENMINIFLWIHAFWIVTVILMCSSSSAGSTWSYWPSRTRWSTWSCCKCPACGCVYRSFSASFTVFVPPVSVCILWLWLPLSIVLCRAQMVNLVPEVSRVCSARREMKEQEDSQDLQAQSGCRCGKREKCKLWSNVIIKKHWD